MTIAIPAWITAIFSHSIGEFADGLWTKVTAEDKAAAFDRGWGDEHQLIELLSKLKPDARPVWMEFIRWNFVDRAGFATRNVARGRQKKLRLFLTSWDKQVEKGTKTKTVEKKVDDKTSEKVQTVSKIFKNATNNARDFVARCVEIITSKEAEMLKQCETHLPVMIANGELKPGHQLSKYAKMRCREAGYRELVKYFEAAQLPIMPAPNDGHWTESIDTWIKNQVGGEVQPVEVVKAAVVKAGAGMLTEMERDKARLAAAKKSWFAPVLYPITIFRNLVS